MTDLPTPSSDRPTYASAGALAGLASEVEALRRTLDPLHELPKRVDHLARLIAELGDLVNTRGSAAADPVAAPSWLDLPSEMCTVCALLGELTDWLAAVFLRYPDAAQALPECWLWHPPVIEELLWLMHAWRTAYRGTNASVALAGDWHDRYRPGVVRRIHQSAGRCSLENHQPRDGAPIGDAPAVPLISAAEDLASWWAVGRHDAPPTPTVAHLAAANDYRTRSGGARR